MTAMLSPFDQDRVAMETMGKTAIDALADFLESLPEAATVHIHGAEQLFESLLRPPAEMPGSFNALLDTFRRASAYAMETAGPGYLGYIPAGGMFNSALAELLARTVNRHTGLSGLAPGLVATEEGVVRRLCDLFGLPAEANGLITTGGSMATLSAVLAARYERPGEDFMDGTLYVTSFTNPCVDKAARIAGFPAARLRVVPTTADLRMDVGALASMIAEELTTHGRARIDGIERCDWLVVDPHKGLFLPDGTGVLLARDSAGLGAGMDPMSPYFHLEGFSPLPDYVDLTPELTREFRGLRVWLPLHLHEVAAFRNALDEKLDLADFVYCELAADPRLEVPWEPELSIVAFRLRTGDNDANRRFLTRINASSRVFLSGTMMDGCFTPRLCVLSHRTRPDQVTEAVKIIRDAAQAG
jgi:aromatic-L-amino-acid/L-tryptophan decarboxylase